MFRAKSTFFFCIKIYNQSPKGKLHMRWKLIQLRRQDCIFWAIWCSTLSREWQPCLCHGVGTWWPLRSIPTRAILWFYGLLIKTTAEDIIPLLNQSEAHTKGNNCSEFISFCPTLLECSWTFLDPPPRQRIYLQYFLFIIQDMMFQYRIPDVSINLRELESLPWSCAHNVDIKKENAASHLLKCQNESALLRLKPAASLFPSYLTR